MKDTFRGDTAALIRNIDALLELDAAGALVPHGVGGHARGLLEAASVRLAAPAQPLAPEHLFELWWAEYMPEANQARAWEAWCAAPKAEPAAPGAPSDDVRSVYSRSMDLVRTFWQQHTKSDALSMTMAELHADVELVIRAARGAAQAAPVDAQRSALEDAARALVEAIEYTPLGLRSIKALEKVRAALSSSAQGAPVDAPELTQASRDVLAERQRQISAEGWTLEHDDVHRSGEIRQAAACYVAGHRDLLVDSIGAPLWPWSWGFKPADPRRMLVKGLALGLAEIERLDRVAARAAQKETP